MALSVTPVADRVTRQKLAGSFPATLGPETPSGSIARPQVRPVICGSPSWCPQMNLAALFCLALSVLEPIQEPSCLGSAVLFPPVLQILRMSSLVAAQTVLRQIH